jgi:hypothetical protein
MGVAYNGLGGNIAPPASVAISNVTGTGPLEVTTGAAHGMLTGDEVDIFGVQGAVGANGSWIVTVIDATHYTLNGSSATAAYTTGGTSQSVVFSGNVGLNPANGDALNASTWIPGMSCPQDRTSYLAARLGFCKLVSITKFINDNDNPATQIWTSNPPSAVSTWTIINGSAPAGYPVTVSDCQSGDIFEFDFAATISPSGNSSISFQKMAIMTAFYSPGGSPLFAKLPGSGQALPNGGSNPLTIFNLKGYLSLSASSALFGQFGIGIYQVGATGAVALEGDSTLVVKQWRPTGWPQ